MGPWSSDPISHGGIMEQFTFQVSINEDGEEPVIATINYTPGLMPRVWFMAEREEAATDSMERVIIAMRATADALDGPVYLWSEGEGEVVNS